jgi:hypothetical protein
MVALRNIDNGGALKPLSETYAKGGAWEGESEPIFRFWVDGMENCFYFSFFNFGGAQYNDIDKGAVMIWPGGQLHIKGPGTLDFMTAFSQHRATNLQADGRNITSVKFISPKPQPKALSPEAQADKDADEIIAQAKSK